MSLFPVQDSFVRGEASPRLHSRATLDLYRAALSSCANFVTLPHGGIRKRGGTRFVGSVKYPNRNVRGIAFKYSQEQAYWLEFGDMYVRVYAYGGFVVEFASPWAHAHVKDLQFAQSSDVMWVVHPNYAPRKITRVSNAVWTVQSVSFTDGPFMARNLDEGKTAYVSAVAGSITITASDPIFTVDDVGSLFKIAMESYANITPWEANARINDPTTGPNVRYDGRVYKVEGGVGGNRFGATPPTHTKGVEPDGPKAIDPSYSDMVGVDLRYRHSGFGTAKITGFTSSTVVTATVLSRFPEELVGSGNASYLYSFGAFRKGNYPVATALFEERLFFASKLSVYGSKVGDFESFATGEKDDDGLEFVLAANEANDILWLTDADGFLAIGTLGGVRALSGSGIDEALTPSSFKNRSSATHRCSKIRPINSGVAFLYVTSDKYAVAEMSTGNSGRFQTQDATQVSEHLSKKGGGITDIAYAESPDGIAWLTTEVGEPFGFTYQADQEVRGFHRHPLGGKVLDVVVTPAQTGGDDVTFIVERVINGQTVRYIEIMKPPFEYGVAADVFNVDCGLTYSGSAVNTVTGLAHLSGVTVDILASGRKYSGVVNGSGQVSLPGGATATKIHVGIPLASEAQSLELDVGARDGSLMGRKKRISAIYLSLLETDLTGLTVASLIKGRWEPVKLHTIKPDAVSVELFTGTVGPIPIDDSWEGRGQWKLRHTGPGPCTVRAITPAFDNEP